jgi:proteasome lid subunit RPN8/RPN11
LLKECCTYLTADPNGFERLHLVTGIAFDRNRYTLGEMQNVAMSVQSHVGAKADQQAFTKALIELSTCGHALLGLFHSHPGSHPAATHPSEIDVTTHKRLEAGDMPLIGAIFVKGHPGNPGYVRFFNATNRPFTITIYGTGITPVPGEEHVYQIQSPSLSRRVSYETIAGS